MENNTGKEESKEPTEQEMDEFTAYVIQHNDSYIESSKDKKWHYIKANDEDIDFVVATCLGEASAYTISESINGFHDAVEKIIFMRDLVNTVGHNPVKALEAIKRICDAYMSEWAMFSKHWEAVAKEEEGGSDGDEEGGEKLNGFKHDD